MNATNMTRLDSGDCFGYHLVDNGVVIAKCEPSNTTLSVPDSLNGRPVIGLADSSFSRLFILKRVVLPHGLTSIGSDAFKGCVSLREVVLPDTLQSVGSGAFRSTALELLSIPAACTDISDDSFNLQGSWTTPPSTIRPSSLKSIVVESENPKLTETGGMLCRQTESGLRVLLCPNAYQDVSLKEDIVSVVPSAFTGVERISTLRLSDSIRATDRDVVFPGNACDTLIVESNDGQELSLSMPSEEVSRKTLASLFRAKRVDLAQALSSFDNALPTVSDRSALARAMLDRLASKRFPLQDVERRYRMRLSSSLDSVCLDFAVTNHWTGFDQLLDCDLLNGQNIMHVIDVLSRFDETAAVGYLLQAKRRLFGKATWDYGI